MSDRIVFVLRSLERASRIVTTITTWTRNEFLFKEEDGRFQRITRDSNLKENFQRIIKKR